MLIPFLSVNNSKNSPECITINRINNNRKVIAQQFHIPEKNLIRFRMRKKNEWAKKQVFNKKLPDNVKTFDYSIKISYDKWKYEKRNKTTWLSSKSLNFLMIDEFPD